MARNVIVDIDYPVLLGRGIWNINGETVIIEVPGWYMYDRGHWRYADEPVTEYVHRLMEDE